MLTTALVTLPPVKPPKDKAINWAKRRTHGDPETAVLLLSDIHGFEKVEPTDTPSGIIYNQEVMEKRLSSIPPVVSLLTELERQSKPINELVVFLLGDMVTGENIYLGQSFHIIAPAIVQMTETARAVAKLIHSIAPLFPKIRVECIPGNHGRVAPRGVAHYRSNWDTLCYYQIKQDLAQTGHIKVNIYETPIATTTIRNRTIGFSHGADLAAGSSCLASTAAQRAAYQWAGLLGKPLDACFFGHFHRPAHMMVGNTDVIMNGSLVGGNHFSATRIRECTPPIQYFFGVHPQRITWVYRIDFPEVKG